MLIRFALPYIVLMTTVDVFWKVVARWDIHPLYFTAQTMAIGGLVLLLISRPGNLMLDTLRSVGTWAYGLTALLLNMFFIYILVYTDIVIADVMTSMALVISWIFAFVFLGRNRFTWIASGFLCLMLLCIGGLAMTLDPSIRLPVVLLSFGFSLMLALKSLSQETHKASNRTRGNFIHECRVSGFVMGITALIFGSALAMLGLVAAYYELSGLNLLIPTTQQLLSIEGVAMAFLYGIFAGTALRYMEFFWIKKISSESYVFVMQLLPIVAVPFEIFADHIGLVSFGGLTWWQLVFIIGVMSSTIGAYHFSRKLTLQQAKPVGKAARLQIHADHRIAQHTLEYCDGDKRKAAKLLGIAGDTLQAALHAPQTNIPLSPKASQTMHSHFGENVATADPLTGLMNKTHFLSLFRDVLERGDTGILLYLDLNKFKPINDTHGHEAGDEVLKIIAQRLTANINRNSIISRLGGDEFAVMLTNVKVGQGEEIQQRLAEKISEPMQLEGVDQAVTVGASIGWVTFPTDGTDAEMLLNTADKRMYDAKKEAK